MFNAGDNDTSKESRDQLVLFMWCMANNDMAGPSPGGQGVEH